MAAASLFVHSLDQTVLMKHTSPMLSHVNVSTGAVVTIKELAETIKNVVGFGGEFVFDLTKPDGIARKLMDVSVLANLGWSAGVSLKSGLERSYADFRSILRGESRL